MNVVLFLFCFSVISFFYFCSPCTLFSSLWSCHISKCHAVSSVMYFFTTALGSRSIATTWKCQNSACDYLKSYTPDSWLLIIWHHAINIQFPVMQNCYIDMCHCICKTYIYIYIYIYISGGPLSALTCCVNVRLLSAIKKNIAVNLFSKLGWELGLYYASYDDFHHDILARMYT